MNRPPIHRLMRIMPGFAPTRARLAVLTTKYWGAKGVKLTVGFLDNPSAELKARILLHMNAWGKYANVTFVPTRTDPQVRVARTPGDGHWTAASDTTWPEVYYAGGQKPILRGSGRANLSTPQTRTGPRRRSPHRRVPEPTPRWSPGRDSRPATEPGAARF